MNVSVYELIGDQFVRSLTALSNNLLKARDFAKERNFDDSKFLDFKLAPDMFTFSRQVQIATDTAKGAVCRLSGKEAPVFADDEKTIDELLTRIDRTIHLIKEFKPTDFEGYETRKVSFPYTPGVYLNGRDYLVTHAIPNFYFHTMTVYCMLRAAGVPVGKKDFLGSQNWKPL